MYNTALRIVNDTALAEDIMQESFLEAFSRIDTYRRESSFGSWMKKIVIHKSIDEFRKIKDVISFDAVEAEVVDLNDDENYIQVLSTRVEEIRKSIHALPDAYRVILSLYLLEGYDHEEISQILGISYNLSRTRYSRARKKLLDMIGASESNSSNIKTN